MKAAVIMNDEEWERYKDRFPVGSMMHGPMVPPSYPVIVISVLEERDYGHGTHEVRHSFIEQIALKKMLGMPWIS
jgi:hypothetical protein